MKRLVVSMALFVLLVGAEVAGAALFTDDFEAPTLDPSWIKFETGGSVALTTDKAHSGKQSVLVTVTSDDAYINVRNVGFKRRVLPPSYGTASVWFFDEFADRLATYSSILYINTDPNSEPGTALGVGGTDFGYGPAGFYRIGAGSNFPPPANDGFTPIDRTPAWHYFEIQSLPDTGTHILIGDDDGQGGVTNLTTVYSATASVKLDAVEFGLGAGWGNPPPFTAYWDDFKFVPEPTSCSLLVIVAVLAATRRRASRS